MSIALNLLDQLQRIATRHHAARITQVEVLCGVLQQVVPEALQAAFAAAAADTLAAGATLTIREEGLVVRCRACGVEYGAAPDDYLCPQCGQADVQVISGRDIILKAVVAETPHGAVL